MNTSFCIVIYVDASQVFVSLAIWSHLFFLLLSIETGDGISKRVDKAPTMAWVSFPRKNSIARREVQKITSEGKATVPEVEWKSWEITD